MQPKLNPLRLDSDYSCCTYRHYYQVNSFLLLSSSSSSSSWHKSQTRVRASSFSTFLYHTQWHITVGRTPLDEGSARRRQHSQETDFHACRGVWTRNPSKWSDVNPRLRPLGHWDHQQVNFPFYSNYFPGRKGYKCKAPLNAFTTNGAPRPAALETLNILTAEVKKFTQQQTFKAQRRSRGMALLLL